MAALAGVESLRARCTDADRRSAAGCFPGQSLCQRKPLCLECRLPVCDQGRPREARYPLADLERPFEREPVAHDLVDEADRVSLGRVDDAPGEDQVERTAQAHHARQALRPTVDQGDAEAPLGASEPR